MQVESISSDNDNHHDDNHDDNQDDHDDDNDAGVFCGKYPL